MEPRKEVAEADAFRKAEGNTGPRATEGRLGRGQRAGHVGEGFLENLGDLVDAVEGRYGRAKETKRSRGRREVGAS
jgi:hypothetical protein